MQIEMESLSVFQAKTQVEAVLSNCVPVADAGLKVAGRAVDDEALPGIDHLHVREPLFALVVPEGDVAILVVADTLEEVLHRLLLVHALVIGAVDLHLGDVGADEF